MTARSHFNFRLEARNIGQNFMFYKPKNLKPLGPSEKNIEVSLVTKFLCEPKVAHCYFVFSVLFTSLGVNFFGQQFPVVCFRHFIYEVRSVHTFSKMTHLVHMLLNWG